MSVKFGKCHQENAVGISEEETAKEGLKSTCVQQIYGLERHALDGLPSFMSQI